ETKAESPGLVNRVVDTQLEAPTKVIASAVPAWIRVETVAVGVVRRDEHHGIHIKLCDAERGSKSHRQLLGYRERDRRHDLIVLRHGGYPAQADAIGWLRSQNGIGKAGG